jgi:acetyl-CoA carboxylase alpha subunit
MGFAIGWILGFVCGVGIGAVLWRDSSKRGEEADDQKIWGALNRERGRLIEREINGTITASEKELLDALNALADARLAPLLEARYRYLEEIAKKVKGK